MDFSVFLWSFLNNGPLMYLGNVSMGKYHEKKQTVLHIFKTMVQNSMHICDVLALFYSFSFPW